MHLARLAALVTVLAGFFAAALPCAAQGQGAQGQGAQGPGTQAPAADARQLLFGARDFEMDWRAEPTGRRMRLRFHGESRRLRIEALDGSEEVLIKDFAKGDVFVMIAEGKKGIYGTKGAPAAPFRPESAGELQQIAGETCRDLGREGRVFCLTDDGIPVEIRVGAERIVAERLLRQAQNAALFELPKGVPVKAMPPNAAKLPF